MSESALPTVSIDGGGKGSRQSRPLPLHFVVSSDEDAPAAAAPAAVAPVAVAPAAATPTAAMATATACHTAIFIVFRLFLSQIFLNHKTHHQIRPP